MYTVNYTLTFTLVKSCFFLDSAIGKDEDKSMKELLPLVSESD